MKFTIERAPLLKALSHLQGVVERRITIPVLGNVMVKAEGGSLSLTATDMDIELAETAAASVMEDGVTTVPVRTLYDILRKCRDGALIEFQVSKAAAVMRAGRSSFTIPILPAEDFPIMSAGEFTHHFTVPAADLRALIDRTKFAISTEETRYYLGGIYLHAAKEAADSQIEHLRAVTTNGHQLARVDVTLPDGASGMPGVIVPRKTVFELRKLIEDDGDVSVSVGASKIKFVTAGATMTSKLIDGTFPEYSRVIPTKNDKVLEIPRVEFTSAIDRVSTISSDRTRAVRMEIGKGSLTLAVESPGHGSAVEDIEARYNAEEMRVGFNSRYLLDIAGQIGDEAMRFTLADPGAPALVSGAVDQSSLYVIMPMRI